MMKWSESLHPKDEDGVSTPTIKNHSVTHHAGHLYCFGGYDGRRNHQTLLVYSLKEKRWLSSSNTNGRTPEYVVRGVPPPGRNGHTATLAVKRRRRRRTTTTTDENGIGEEGWMERQLRGMHVGGDGQEEKVLGISLSMSMDSINSSSGEHNLMSYDSSDGNHVASQTSDRLSMPHSNPNDTLSQNDSTHTHNHHPQPQTTQTQLEEEEEEEEDAQIIIIGGWLGSGPLAASDTWILDLSSGLPHLRWHRPAPLGTPPGPCNMHSADYIPPRNEVYVFRGGNGREYLNDLHAFHAERHEWRAVAAAGKAPQPRANHSSAVLESGERCELFIFGGWNGSERLNDVFVFDVETSTWSEPRVGGVKPHPRAGMTLTALRGRLFLFGGSGTSSKCFDDLQILDRKEMAWLDVNDERDGGVYNTHQKLITYGNSRLDHHHDGLDWYSWGGASDGESLGGQDGMTEGERNDTVNGSNRENNTRGINHNHDITKFSDWRSQESHRHPHNQHLGFSSSACTSANPNDEDMVHSVFVTGNPPGKRAGHTATAVGRFIYVFGGSCGTDYLSDFFVLDTDPPPVVKITEPACPQLYARRLTHFSNNEEFADVIFIVEGKRVYGHKLVLSMVSDCFRAMFMTGFRESGSGCTEIEIPDTNYDIFLAMMEYIYTGRAPKIDVFSSDSVLGMERAIALLELSDQFFLYHLKQICEELLQPAVNVDTFSFLMSIAQKTNASQLELYCRYFERNMNEFME
ncbi:hypothetical protein ACHAW6_008105 [Cyclotella cf. meneghiniana]